MRRVGADSLVSQLDEKPCLLDVTGRHWGGVGPRDCAMVKLVGSLNSHAPVGDSSGSETLSTNCLLMAMGAKSRIELDGSVSGAPQELVITVIICT